MIGEIIAPKAFQRMMFALFLYVFLDRPSMIYSAASAYNITNKTELEMVLNSWIQGCRAHGDINTWDTSRVTDMSLLFQDRKYFNDNISNWNTARVTAMTHMFSGASAFNQPIGSWNTAQVNSMGEMFRNAVAFNQPIGTWNTARVTTMFKMFQRAFAFNQSIDDWNTARVTSMSSLFSSASAFNQPIGKWNTAMAFSMGFMFSSASAFNQPIGTWNTARVSKLHKMFLQAVAFNLPIGHWNTARATSMNFMFDGASAFNQPIGIWNTAAVKHMQGMFHEAVAFNQPIGIWNTGAVKVMQGMFQEAVAFNQPIGMWNTGLVSDMYKMFDAAISFNHPLGQWNTAKVVNMNDMFSNAVQFDQPLADWDIAAVPINGMTSMFSGASRFCQDLSAWTLSLAFPSASASLSCVSTTTVSSTVTASTNAFITSAPKTNTVTASYPVEVLEGRLIVTVSNATQFVNEPNVIAVMKIGIANMLDVNVSWVSMVNVSLAVDRRLLFVATVGEVKVEFRVVIPMTGPARITVDILIKELDTLSFSAANELIDKVINSGVLGQYYTAQVIRKFAWVQSEPVPIPTPSPSDTNSGIWVLWIALVLVLFSSGFLVLVVRTYRQRILRRRSRSIRSSNKMIELSTIGLLMVPERITDDDGRSVRQLLLRYSLCPDNVDTIIGMHSDVDVFIAYAMGTRPQDAAMFGPGAFYAAAVAKTLNGRNIRCFTWVFSKCRTSFTNLLRDPRFEGKMLLVIETGAFYDSRECLLDLLAGHSNHMDIVQLRCDDCLPPLSLRWDHARQTDSDAAVAFEAIKEHMPTMPTVPERPWTIGMKPESLDVWASRVEIGLMVRSSCKVAPTIIGNESGGNASGHVVEPSPSRSEEAHRELNQLGQCSPFAARSLTVPRTKKKSIAVKNTSGPRARTGTAARHMKMPSGESLEVASCKQDDQDGSTNAQDNPTNPDRKPNGGLNDRDRVQNQGAGSSNRVNRGATTPIANRGLKKKCLRPKSKPAPVTTEAMETVKSDPPRRQRLKTKSSSNGQAHGTKQDTHDIVAGKSEGAATPKRKVFKIAVRDTP